MHPTLSYYPEPNDTPDYVSVNPRPLQPLETPPSFPPPPDLPSPRRDSPFRGYQLTSHIVPAAYPRSPGNLQPKIPKDETPEERKERVKRFMKDLIEARLAEQQGTQRAQVRETALYNVFNRYVLSERPKSGVPISLLVLQANGFPKEIWEPCLGFLINEMKQSTNSTFIEEIWTMDAVNHGDSGLVNEKYLTDSFDWADHARDILNFVANYLPESGAQDVSTHLPAIGRDISGYRLTRGFQDRTLVALGHSFGGCSATRAALHAPQLFSSLVLVDPVILPSYKIVDGGFAWMSKRCVPALSRRTMWSSREEALNLFLKSPFFQVWHPDALRAYVDYGIAPDFASNVVKLKCSGYQEAVVFSDGLVARETWELLSQLDEKIEVYFIMAGTGAEVSGGEDAAQQVVWRRRGNCSHVRVGGAGHLITQEKPRELAILVADFLHRKYDKNSSVHSKL